MLSVATPPIPNPPKGLGGTEAATEPTGDLEFPTGDLEFPETKKPGPGRGQNRQSGP